MLFLLKGMYSVYFKFKNNKLVYLLEVQEGIAYQLFWFKQLDNFSLSLNQHCCDLKPSPSPILFMPRGT